MCECEICVRSRSFNDVVEALPAEHQEYFRVMYDQLLEIEHERDYYKVIVDGTWPNADEVIKHIRSKRGWVKILCLQGWSCLNAPCGVFRTVLQR